MPTDEPAGRRISTFFDKAAPAERDTVADAHDKAVEIFSVVLEEWIAPETSDAEIERAFHTALAEWRRTAPERAAAERVRQAEAERRVRGRSVTTVSAPSAEAMIDPARVFQDSTDAGKS